MNVPSSGALKKIVPAAVLSGGSLSGGSLSGGSSNTIDIGAVTPLSTVVAQAVELELNSSQTYQADIASTQEGPLTQVVDQEGQDIAQQQQEVDSQSYLSTRAQVAISEAANLELSNLFARPSEGAAATTLLGLLGFLHVGQQSSVDLSSARRAQLIAAQIGGHTYSYSDIATRFQTVGLQGATPTEVANNSRDLRQTLPALSATGSSISPFEALLLAASQQGQGGFGASQSEIDALIPLL